MTNQQKEERDTVIYINPKRYISYLSKHCFFQKNVNDIIQSKHDEKEALIRFIFNLCNLTFLERIFNKLI